jgi:hypothetical protein
MTNITATDLYNQTQRDFAEFVIYGARSTHELQMATVAIKAEGDTLEADWSPITAGVVRTHCRNAYKFSGQ